MNIIEELRALRRKGISQELNRGILPKVGLTNTNYTWKGFWIFLASFIIAGFLFSIWFTWVQHENFSDVGGKIAACSATTGLFVAGFYYLLPIFAIFWWLAWHHKRPPREILSKFSGGQKFVCLLLIAFCLIELFNYIYPQIAFYYSNGHVWPYHLVPYFSNGWHVVVVVFLLTFVLAVFVPFLLPKEVKQHRTLLKRLTGNFSDPGGALPFGLWLGHSTGRLSALWHQAGLAANHSVVLRTEDAAQNIVALGGIGAGKTTRLMQPLLAQLLDQECGGLLFDVKGDVKKTVLKLAQMVDRPITVIGPNHNKMNLLAGLTPEVAASFLKSAFLLSSGTRLDGFWMDTASELCRNTLGILSFFPEHYTLESLYNYLFDDEFRESLQSKINLLLVDLEPEKQRLLKIYLRYYDSIFVNFDEKVKSGVNATVAQALSPFSHPDLIDAFCQHSQENFNMQSVLDGMVYLVDMPLTSWGLGGKVAYTFIKLRFFNVMQSRIHHPEYNQDRPVFFMCDEYQELISASKDGLSDLNFWDKSRSSKTFGIISAQSVSSFYAALGDRDLAHAILQNFRQKICFRTEDQATLAMMDMLAGKAKIRRKTVSKTTGNSSRSIGEPSSKHNSRTQSITETRESVLDSTLFRNLSPSQAVALLSIDGQSMDDVLELISVIL